ncbi:unnamed protein product (macronuclear) [Paramecium tetraurelia]|uniref:SUN domain-containing protein n=1 Tax=Paramecium tetraurelia TaxID=5888 RepID=A0BKI6_PARTE|nr:uncharacterized protein GSPATT00029684001 [Paramecium tetraurelia]CAK59053.1 unnamed protein product [Paramecium tetraurelia]|eukprot:XP_001426451.1 hypothetical protein (macronuclear) [Paramecium tetraurelia strain d4-2]
MQTYHTIKTFINHQEKLSDQLSFYDQFLLMAIQSISLNWINTITNIDNWFENIWSSSQTKITQKNPPSAQNFASQFGGAIILTKSSALKQVDNVLVDSVEVYMITECNQKMCFLLYVQKKRFLQKQQHLQIKSCIPQLLKTFKQVYGSVVYPTRVWELLGNFYAEDINEWQIFNLDQRFLRYLKILIVDFHNAEFHCTLTQIRVFGKTVIGDLIDSHKRDKVIEPETKTKNLTQEQQEIKLNEVSEEEDRSKNDTCSVVDYFYSNQISKRIKNQYINVLPYESRQSLFKVTAQNILILSHNVELFKNEINQIKHLDIQYQNEQDQIKAFQQQLITSISEQKLINERLESELYFINLKLLTMFIILVGITSILLFISFCNQNKQSSIQQQRVSIKAQSAIFKSQPELMTPKFSENNANTNTTKQTKNSNGKSKKSH